DAIFEQLEVLFLEIGDRLAVPVADDDVHRDRGGGRGEMRLSGGGRLRAEYGCQRDDRPAHQDGVDPVLHSTTPSRRRLRVEHSPTARAMDLRTAPWAPCTPHHCTHGPMDPWTHGPMDLDRVEPPWP